MDIESLCEKILGDLNNLTTRLEAAGTDQQSTEAIEASIYVLEHYCKQLLNEPSAECLYLSLCIAIYIDRLKKLL